MKMKAAAFVVVTVVALLAAWWYEPHPGATPAAAPDRAATAGPYPIDTSGLEFRGMAIQVASGWYQPEQTYFPLLDEIADLGGNAVILCVPGTMEHATSQSIYLDLRKIPPPEDFKRIIAHAKERGLHVILMPIVLLQNPRGSEWRGVIEPPDWDAWWRDYEDFVLYFANLAREGDADALIVGSELISTERFTQRWRDLIAKCREYFYGGLLGYSANWDHYKPIQFWDALDFIGMTSYYTLADHNSPSVAEIVERWRPIKEQILDWQRTVHRPILFTEVGWCSQEGAAQAPWNYYHNQKATPAGLEEQRRLYDAFIRTWSDTPGLLGVMWWEWNGDAGGAGDFGYTPKGKPAENVLRRWFAAGRAPATTTRPAADPAEARR